MRLGYCWNYRFSNLALSDVPVGADQFIQTYAAFRLTCRLPHCRFDDDICTTAQAPLAAEG